MHFDTFLGRFSFLVFALGALKTVFIVLSFEGCLKHPLGFSNSIKPFRTLLDSLKCLIDVYLPSSLTNNQYLHFSLKQKPSKRSVFQQRIEAAEGNECWSMHRRGARLIKLFHAGLASPQILKAMLDIGPLGDLCFEKILET